MMTPKQRTKKRQQGDYEPPVVAEPKRKRPVPRWAPNESGTILPIRSTRENMS